MGVRSRWLRWLLRYVRHGRQVPSLFGTVRVDGVPIMLPDFRACRVVSSRSNLRSALQLAPVPAGTPGMPRCSRILPSVLGVVLAACTVVQPITSDPAPVRVEDYLRTHRLATLRVVDSSGRAHWFYDAEVRGDTLHGARSSFRPREEISLPLSQVADVGARSFSGTRTVGLLVAGILAAVGLLALTASKPIP